MTQANLVLHKIMGHSYSGDWYITFAGGKQAIVMPCSVCKEEKEIMIDSYDTISKLVMDRMLPYSTGYGTIVTTKKKRTKK